MQPRIIAVGSVVLLVVAGLLWWWWSAREAEVAPTPAPTTAPAPVPGEPEPLPEQVPLSQVAPQPTLPRLDESDDFVREEVGALSERLTDWLAQDDLVRRFAVVVENAAKGEIPRQHLGFLAPPGKFAVREVDGKFYVDPAGYARFDPFVDTVLSVPPEQAAALLRNLAPLLREALAELGLKQPDPVAAVRASIGQALQTPDVDGEIELVQPKVVFRYADPQLEALPPLQKQLLRMGPANLARIKAHLREIQRYL